MDCTVFMPVFNGADYVAEAIDSVLAQRGPAFELLVVDDASDDLTPAVLARYGDDARVRVIRQPQQLGVSAAGNLALREAKGRYLLRLDADDRAWPGRLKHQVQLLDAHPACAVVGGQMQMFGNATNQTHVPLDDATIKSHFMACAGNICNPAAALRLDFFRRAGLQYDTQLRVAEDLMFWIDAMCAGARFMNTAQFVTLYRIHRKQASQARQAELAHVLPSLRKRLFLRWFNDLTDAQADLIARVFGPGNIHLSRAQAQEAVVTLGRLQAQRMPSADGENRDSLQQYLREMRMRWAQALAQTSPS